MTLDARQKKWDRFSQCRARAERARNRTVKPRQTFPLTVYVNAAIVTHSQRLSMVKTPQLPYSAVLPDTLDLLILKALSHGRQHGFGIARWLEAVTAHVLRLDDGMLYPALHRVERCGWLESEWGISGDNRQVKYYRLTRRGGEHLQRETAVWTEQRIRQQVLGHLETHRGSLLKECPRCGRCYDPARDRCDLDGAELTWSLPVDRTVAQRYRLERLLGRGGMGAVYEAVDERLHRRVAVKVMLGGRFGIPDALRRFQREARAIARLNHVNIISVFDYGVLPGQGAFLVMELAHGRTLRAELAHHGSFPPSQCPVWIEQILNGVTAAHAQGVIHRDLKPENVLVTPTDGSRDAIKLLDFGLARFRASPDEEDTATASAPGVALGTLAYMAPEQMLAQQVDERADLFSLGVMIVEILTGRKVFSENPARRLVEIHEALLPRTLDDDRARAVLTRCLAANPNDRYASVAEAAHDLLPAIQEVAADRWRAAAPSSEVPTC
jgi:transcriptional regulator